MNRDVFCETYGNEPIRMIDLKALMGDSSDNIPGVKGIGEKTALKLLQEYDTIEKIYENIDSIKGATKVKLENDKESAIMSKDLATIYKDVPLDISFDGIKYDGVHSNKLLDIYNELEFYSFVKKEQNVTKQTEEIKINIINDLSNINIENEVAVYLELDNENYHNAKIIGLSLYNKEISGFIPYEVLEKNLNFLYSLKIFTYDIKRLYVSFAKRDVILNNLSFDTMISGYLLNYNVKEDIAYLANNLGYELNFYDKKEKIEYEELIRRSINKAKFIYETKETLLENMNKEEVIDLYNNIEFPLALVLSKMELEGIRVDKQVLFDMKEELSKKLELVTKEIYDYAGEEFNIASPTQ